MPLDIQTGLVVLAILVAALLFIEKQFPVARRLFRPMLSIVLLPLLLAKRLLWDSPAEAKGPAFAFAVLLFLVAFGFLCTALILAGHIGLIALTILTVALVYNWLRKLFHPKALRTMPRRRRSR